MEGRHLLRVNVTPIYDAVMSHDAVRQGGEAWRWVAVTAARRIGVGEVSSREVVASVLDRVEAVNPSVNKVVDVMAEAAFASAALADDAVARGEVLGPLHGVPITIKVNVDVAGRPTTGGIEERSGYDVLDRLPA